MPPSARAVQAAVNATANITPVKNFHYTKKTLQTWQDGFICLVMLYLRPQISPVLTLFAWMCDGIRAAIAPHARSDTKSGQIISFVYHYLARTLTRLEILFAHWKNGTLPPTRPARPRAEKPKSAEPEPQPARLPIPQGTLWLVKRVQKAAIGQSALLNLLNDAEFAAFLREVPRATRLLRPLATALGVVLPGTRPRVHKPRPPRPKPAPAAKTPTSGKYPRFSYRTYSPGKIPRPRA